MVNARILLWGHAGAGKSTTLRTIHAKLAPELRGELRREATRLDPTVHYETLPISLGEVGGVATHLELVAVPGAADQAMTRKQLLDEVDGIVLVLDCAPEAIESNLTTIEELRTSLDAYGRSLETFPIVLQYNKRDVADPFAIEDLHRRIGLEQCAVFETIATTGHGILPTLTTISKHVVRARRGGATRDGLGTTGAAPAATAPVEAAAVVEAPALDIGLDELEEIEVAPLLEAEGLDSPVTPTEAPSTADLLESAILAEGADEADWDASGRKAEASLGSDLRIVSVGQASLAADGGVRLPLVLGDEAGATRSVVLSLRLDALVDGDAGPDD